MTARASLCERVLEAERERDTYEHIAAEMTGRAGERLTRAENAEAEAAALRFERDGWQRSLEEEQLRGADELRALRTERDRLREALTNILAEWDRADSATMEPTETIENGDGTVTYKYELGIKKPIEAARASLTDRAEPK